jgi:hypothetical protein
MGSIPEEIKALSSLEEIGITNQTLFFGPKSSSFDQRGCSWLVAEVFGSVLESASDEHPQRVYGLVSLGRIVFGSQQIDRNHS